MVRIIIGPMGSGKSEQILSDINYIKKLGDKVVCFKPKQDTRAKDEIKSRNGMSHKAIEVENLRQMYNIMKDLHFKGIRHFVCDEIQFFRTEELKMLMDFIHSRDIVFIASGLNQTSEMEPFLPTAKFAMYADEIIVKTGECVYCGGKSKRTICKVDKKDTVLVGDDIYEATCYACGSIKMY